MKYHPAETCIEMTGTQDRVNQFGDIIRMSQWIAPSNEVAKIAHTWFEDLKTVPEWLQIGHNKRYVRRIVTHVYDSESTRWSGQYSHAIRTVRLNVARLDPIDVIDTCTHEIAHCFFHNNTKNPLMVKFIKVVMNDLGAIDHYSRGRKLQGYKRKTPIKFVNEIHSILAALKHGLNSAQELEQDENRTKAEIEHFKKYAAAFDKVHTEKPTNKNWVKMQT
jgi:hypothetical protein